MIRGHVGFATAKAARDGQSVTPATIVSGVGRTDILGRPRLLTGQQLTIATDRPSSVLVQTNRGGWWITSGAGPVVYTASEPVTVIAIHVQPPLTTSEQEAFSGAMHPQVDRVVTESAEVRWCGATFKTEHPAQPASQTIAANRRGVMRCELQPGWAWWKDAAVGNTNQRSELVCQTPLPFETDVWVSSPLFIEPGEPLASDSFAILGQMWTPKDDPADLRARTPVFRQVLLPNDTLSFATCSDPAAATTVQPAIVVRWSIPNFPRGSWQYLVHRMRFSRTGAGHLQSWWNGQQMYDADIPFGYNDIVGHVWKFGVYKHPSATESLAVRYRNVEHGTASLADRITTPAVVS